jgi:hypothetical protein
MKKIAKPLLMASLVALTTVTALWGGAAQAAASYVNATVEGALAPGVYGRIDIGSAPPPPLVYAQPLIIYRTPVMVQQQPLYLHVPPGQAKKWSKHCAKYNACSRPVYFVQVRGDDNYEWRKENDRRGVQDRGQDRGQYGGQDNGHEKGHGKGHGGGGRD